jgi:hypothetical protein
MLLKLTDSILCKRWSSLKFRRVSLNLELSRDPLIRPNLSTLLTPPNFQSTKSFNTRRLACVLTSQETLLWNKILQVTLRCQIEDSSSKVLSKIKEIKSVTRFWFAPTARLPTISPACLPILDGPLLNPRYQLLSNFQRIPQNLHLKREDANARFPCQLTLWKHLLPMMRRSKVMVNHPNRPRIQQFWVW